MTDETSGLGTWQGRPNKTRQDSQSENVRTRVRDAAHRVEWAKKHKPRTSIDWQAYRGRTD